MSELPRGWVNAEIQDLCTLINGRAFKPKEWSEIGLPIIRIQNLNNPNANFNHYSGSLDNKHLIKKGDLLFAWSGTPGTSFGSHIWRGNDAALNQHIFKIEFSDLDIDRNFFRYAINQKLEELIGSAQGGVGLRHVTKGVFEKTVIAFPPRLEQARIAQKLYQLLTQVDILKTRIDAIPTLLKHFRQSVLSAAVSGRLTEEWRTQNTSLTNIESSESNGSLDFVWPEVSLSDVALGFSYGSSAKSKPSGDIPVLRMGNIQNGKLDWSNLVFTSDENEINKFTLEPGDVLFNRTNSPQLVGKTAIYKGERPAIYAGYLIRIRCSKELNPNYLHYCLNSPQGRHYCWQVKTDGVSQSNINAKKLAAFRFGLPVVEEQTEIVRRVEQLFAFADQLEAKVATAKNRIDYLTQSILAKAFRGELVPQDPNDEPASVLLERIKAQRAATPKVKRGRKASV